MRIDKISNELARKIAKELNYDSIKEEEIAYGLFGLIQSIISVGLVAIIGVIFNVFIEAIIISFTTSILRKMSGGIHSSSSNRCLIIGTFTSVFLALLTSEIDINLRIVGISGIVLFSISYYIVNKLAPVDSKAKPIRKVERRNRLRKQSINILNVYMIITLLNIMMYLQNYNSLFLIYCICIYSGTAFQVLSLTKYGQYILHRIDKMIGLFIK